MTTPATSGRTGHGGDRDAIFWYQGSTFNEVRAVAFSGPYAGALPRHRGLGPKTFLRFFNDSARNLIDQRDVLPPFDKLIHANGVCFTGLWRIERDSPYTGYFASGSEGLLLVRASVAGPQLDAGQRRSFGIAGKIFPTMDPDERVRPGNFVTVSKLSGERKQHIADYDMTNKPPVGLDPAANLISRVIFRLMDTRPGWRQLHPISALGLSPESDLNTPELMRLKVADATPRVNAKDFRDELRLEHYHDEKLVYAIEVKSFDERAWTRLGSMELTEYAISEGGDKRIHFSIPRDIPDQP